MKTPPAFAVAAAVFLVCLSPLAAEDSLWSENYEASVAQAEAQGKPLLLEFTGSDWCPPCKMMASEVFAQPEFKTFAKDNLLLFKADFPQARQLPAEVVQQNDRLQEQYKVQGYPTLILLSPDGKELARKVGFLPGGPSAFIAWVEASL